MCNRPFFFRSPGGGGGGLFFAIPLLVLLVPLRSRIPLLLLLHEFSPFGSSALIDALRLHTFLSFRVFAFAAAPVASPRASPAGASMLRHAADCTCCCSSRPVGCSTAARAAAFCLCATASSLSPRRARTAVAQAAISWEVDPASLLSESLFGSLNPSLGDLGPSSTTHSLSSIFDYTRHRCVTHYVTHVVVLWSAVVLPWRRYIAAEEHTLGDWLIERSHTNIHAVCDLQLYAAVRRACSRLTPWLELIARQPPGTF